VHRSDKAEVVVVVLGVSVEIFLGQVAKPDIYTPEETRKIQMHEASRL
jgi:hypothetical protein